jgi:hypothetical protein
VNPIGTGRLALSPDGPLSGAVSTGSSYGAAVSIA